MLEFIDSGRNVLLAADTGASTTVRDIAAGVGATFADSATAVIDHLNFDQSDFDGHHSAIIADDFIKNAHILLFNSHLFLFIKWCPLILLTPLPRRKDNRPSALPRNRSGRP